MITLTFNLTLDQLPGAYVIEPAGGFRLLDPATPEEAARTVIPGCDDPEAVETVRLPDSGRRMVVDPWAERDKPINPLGTQFLGRPVYGTAVILPSPES